MADPVDIRGSFDLPPADALRFFEAKGYRISRAGWSEMMHDDHRDFTIARVTNVDVLVTFKRSLTEALAEGRTFESWQKDTVGALEGQGLWEKLGFSERRMRVIYDTNLRTSRAAGQWARIWAARKTRPYLRYSAVLDRRTRPQHRAWHATVLPVEDRWWLTHFPPNGWFCRCSVQQLSERDLIRYGYSVSPKRPSDGFKPFRGVDGRQYNVPTGIDPGFGYNPGEAEIDRLATKAAASFMEAQRVGLYGVATRAFRDIINDSLGQIQAAWAAEFEAALTAGDAAKVADLVDRVIKAGVARKGLADNVFGDKFRGAMANDDVRRFTVTEFARASLADPTFESKLPIGAVTQANSAQVSAQAQIDVSGFQRFISAHEVRHVRNSHGNVVTETLDDQLVVVPEDYVLIEAIIRDPSDLAIEGSLKGGKGLRIAYTAEIDGRHYLYVETVSRKERRITAKTLYKSWKPIKLRVRRP